MTFDPNASLEDLATAPLASPDPGVQLEMAKRGALDDGAEPGSPGAAPPGAGTIARPAGPHQENVDAVALSLAMAKKLGGDAAGAAAFKHGTWAGGSSQGTALKGAAKAGVNTAAGIVKIATATTSEERQKAIVELGTGTVGDVAGIAGAAPVGAAVKGVTSFALAKNTKERKEAATDGVIDTVAEVAGKFGGDVAKGGVQAVGGLGDVLSKDSGSPERAATAQRHFKRLAGIVPIVGPWAAGKVLDGENTRWALRHRGHPNGDGSYTMPNGTTYDPRKGAPTAEHTKDAPSAAQEDAERRAAEQIKP
jgi:hypothetical protein